MANDRIRFESSPEGFHTVLRARVDAYFSERGLSRHAGAGVIGKIVFWLAGSVLLYAGLLGGLLPGPLVLLLGFFVAQVGFNVGHDALHRATSRHAWVNTVLGWSFDLFGGSSYAWKHEHNIVHHTYTNMPGVDRDLEGQPWMRFYPHAKASRRYRWQHVFAFGFYGLTMLAWTFVKDFVQLARPGAHTTASAWAGVLLGKAVHLGVFIAVPLLVYAGPWWHVLIGYLAMQVAVGMTLAIVFQLAHVVEETAFPAADANGLVRGSWAEHQLATTANFSSGGAWATFLTGGLNHQIEHHLFPRISHGHYGALSEIVRRTAAEHGLPYHESPTFFAALASHVRAMRAFGVASG